MFHLESHVSEKIISNNLYLLYLEPPQSKKVVRIAYLLGLADSEESSAPNKQNQHGMIEFLHIVMWLILFGQWRKIDLLPILKSEFGYYNDNLVLA